MDPATDRDAFRQQLDQMTRQLVAVERRAQTLAELNRLLAQGRDPLALAQRAVDLVMRATAAAGSFVYLWHDDAERLVLRAASASEHAPFVGGIRLRLGEGVTGWAGLMRQTVVLDDGAQTDPRFVVIDDIEQDPLRSMIAVPIVVAGSELLGVFTLWSSKASAFNAHAVELATEVGGLLGSGLAHAQTLDELRRHSTVSRFLLTLPPDATTSFQRCVDVLADSIRSHVGASLCIIEVAGSTSSRVDIRPGIAAADENRDVMSAARGVRSRGDLTSLLQQIDPHFDKFTTSFGSLFPVGTITCFRRQRFTDTEHAMIESLAAQAGALIATQVTPTVELPLAGRLAAAPDTQSADRVLHDLGWRSGPTLPVLIRIRSAQYSTHASFDRIVDSLRQLSDQVDNVVWVPSTPTITVLFRHQDKNWSGIEHALRHSLHDRWSGAGRGIAAGIGPVATSATGVAEALGQAEKALCWAEMLDTQVPFVYFEDIAHLQKLPRIALDEFGANVREIVGHFESLIRHDLRHGTALAKTLEVFLTNRGSAGDTATQLFVHRNTLRQRLDRIEDVLGQRVNALGDWAAAALAARLTAAPAPED